MASKKISFDVEARSALKRGVDFAASDVRAGNQQGSIQGALPVGAPVKADLPGKSTSQPTGRQSQRSRTARTLQCTSVAWWLHHRPACSPMLPVGFAHKAESAV